MANKVLSYFHEPHGDNHLGFCNVEVGGKCRMPIRVFKSKAGNVCCGFCSVKIDNQWCPTFGLIDKTKERSFLNECREQVIPMMGATQDPPKKEEPAACVDEGLPF